VGDPAATFQAMRPLPPLHQAHMGRVNASLGRHLTGPRTGTPSPAAGHAHGILDSVVVGKPKSDNHLRGAVPRVWSRREWPGGRVECVMSVG
jgi:hypothetical protein